MVPCLIRSENGAVAIEYALIASLIAMAIITAASNIGTQLAETFNLITNQLNTY